VAGGAGNKKPTAVASRGFLSKAFSTSTSTNGVANYDDDPNYLSNFSIHYEQKIEIPAGGVKLSIRRLQAAVPPTRAVSSKSGPSFRHLIS
jgi:hypothetical protein